MRYLINVLVLTSLLTSCSSSTEDDKQSQKEVVDAVHQPLDKAKAVEQQIFDNTAEQLKQVDDF